MNPPHLPADRFLAGASLRTFSLEGEECSLYVPDPVAVQAAYRQGEIPFPYWSKVWPAAIALGHYLLKHPDMARGKKVLELGAGLGLPSLIAARVSAEVLCTDHAPEAVELARASAACNGLTNLQTAVLDWNHLPQDLPADLVLLSDINYDPQAFDVLFRLVNRFRDRGVSLLLSTPQRLMAKDFIAPLVDLCTAREEAEIDLDGGQTLTTVLWIEGMH